jgi:ubiquinone biosynthesis O-methyltransferase
MNPVRVKFIKNQLIEHRNILKKPFKSLEGISILDVGCGGGLLSESLARLGAKVTAIDPSAENINVAKSHSSHDPWTSTIDYRVATIDDLANTSEKFDAICSLEVILLSLFVGNY